MYRLLVVAGAFAATAFSMWALRPTFPPQPADPLSALPSVAEDTCPCYLKQPDINPCTEIKRITFQGGTDCVSATTIYEDYPDNCSGSSPYLSLGYLNGYERRIFIKFDITGIDPTECRNPDLGFMAPFDSAQLTLFVVNDKQECVGACGTNLDPDGRQFFLAAAQDPWVICRDGKDDSCVILNQGLLLPGCCPTWNTDSKNYYWPFNNQPRNLPFEQPCIDSIVFVCHRPMPYNSPMKRTLREWIIGAWPNNGWVILPDSTQRQQFPNSALLFYSPSYGNPALRPRLRLWFTRGVDRDDRPKCGFIDYIIVPPLPKKK
jgi:hypothetical protein